MSQSQVLETGYRAFECLKHGLATGEWDGFLELLTEDFTFWFPMGPYHGLNVGKERTAEFLNYVTESFGGGLVVTEVERVTSNDTTVVFEFRDQGQLRGQPYKNRVAASFDVRGDKICGYREYFGSDGRSN